MVGRQKKSCKTDHLEYSQMKNIIAKLLYLHSLVHGSNLVANNSIKMIPSLLKRDSGKCVFL